MEKINEDYFGMMGGGFDPTLSPASYNVQGPYPGYTYSILPLNNNLQQKANEVTNDRYIHVGCLVRGVGINNPDRHYMGRVSRILKNEKGEIFGLYVLSQKTGRFVSIRADDNLELIIPKDLEQVGVNTLPVSNNTDITNNKTALSF